MKCPECSGEMEPFWDVVKRNDVFIRRNYGTCKSCCYSCSEDFVSGFWGGVNSVKESVPISEYDQWRFDKALKDNSYVIL